MNTEALAGEYYLEGVREMASGFLLKEDNSFQFFFSYGALDRQGKGTWQLKEDKIVFNSEPWPGYDFSLVSSNKEEEDYLQIHLETGNPVLAIYMYCSLQNGVAESWIPFNQRGDIERQSPTPDNLSLTCEFVPERQTNISIPDKIHNRFNLRLESWIFEYFFSNFELKVADQCLTGAHPFLQKTDWVYKKS